MSLENDIRKVEQLKGSALRERFREVVGVATKSNNRPYLIKSIVKKLREQQESPPAEPATASAAAPEPATREAQPSTKAPSKGKRGAATAPAKASPSHRKRDPRLPPPGSIIEKEHEGKTLRIEVLEDGFVYKGKGYRSLSAIAREVTGTIWNGYLWAGLVPAAKAKQAVGGAQ